MKIEAFRPFDRKKGKRKQVPPTILIDGIIIDSRNRIRFEQTQFEEVVWLNERPILGDVEFYVDGHLVFERVSSDA